MDRSWITQPRLSSTYLNGAREFLDIAFEQVGQDGRIYCPCIDCGNCIKKTRSEVLDDLVCKGFLHTYTTWIYHGEQVPSSSKHNDGHKACDDTNSRINDDMHGLLHEGFGIPNEGEEEADGENEYRWGSNEEVDKFYKLLEDAKKELYPGCKKFSKLSYVVKLYLLKTKHHWTDVSFSELLMVIKDGLPDGETLPKSFNETKKMIGDLGLKYNKIHACPSDCMLYWKEHSNDEMCHNCGKSRWKVFDSGLEGSASTSSSSTNKKIPAKVLRYFPLKPRLQRLFMSSKTASSMRWHGEERIKDGKMRHPADSQVWDSFDRRYPTFAGDFRNVRLALATDGFNPFKTMSVAHSTWPVLLLIYNLPSGMCMKQPYFILSTLIPGPKGPGNDIDVYLQPLIEELKELWFEGVDTYDASRNEMFRMYAAMLWTISDFPSYAMVSGWSTKGYLACPTCNKDTCSRYLNNSKKICYDGHRSFLPEDHRYRHCKAAFDGTEEVRCGPAMLSGTQVLHELEGINFPPFGKKDNDSGNRMEEDSTHNWRKKSIFFQLPYWEHNLIRHNLDVMHIEKNICDNILYTLMNENGRGKDGLKARLDLQEMGIRPSLHPKEHGSNKFYLPPAGFTLSPSQKSILCQVLKNVKVPDGYAANISRCVRLKERKISGLKSHDCHILMQQLLPIAIRRILPKKVCSVLVELSNFFRELCSKTLCPEELEQLERRIVLTLCHMEMIFPPAFFTIMVHLPIHLAHEARIAGPVQYRWMYPIERYLLTLKNYVRNRSHPEGSIAEGYLAEECLTFCSRYLTNIETRFDRPQRNYNNVFDGEEMNIFGPQGRALGKQELIDLDEMTWVQAHRYILFNYDGAKPFIDKHKRFLKIRQRHLKPRQLEMLSHKSFHKWFNECLRNNEDPVPNELRWLAQGPNPVAKRLKAIVINGMKFHVRDLERRRKTQNSGVVLKAVTSSYARATDRNPVTGDIQYYGVLTDIIELDYNEQRKVVLFKCNWFDVLSKGRGIKEDDFRFKLVNSSRSLGSDEPFILASQAEQVFYVDDPIDNEWKVVIGTKPRDFYDMPEHDVETYRFEEPFNAPHVDNNLDVSDDDSLWTRDDVLGTMIDSSLLVNEEKEDDDTDEEDT